MKTKEFIKRVRECGRSDGVTVVWDAARGKGGHGRLTYGSRRTTVPYHSGEIPTGTLRAMQKQLGLEGRF